MAKKDKYPQVGPKDWMNAHGWYAERGGYMPHQGVLPAIMPGMYPGNMPTLMNQQATMPMDMEIPMYEHGGYHAQPGYYYNDHSMQKAVGSGTYDTSGTYFQDGGWKNGMMRGKMATADAMGNPSAHRMVQNYPQTYTFTGQEGPTSDVPAGGIGTHYMASMGEYAVPFIQQQKSGQLGYNKNANYRDKEAIRFNDTTDANCFAEHYKDVAPMMRNAEQQYGGYSDNDGDMDYMKSGGIHINPKNKGKFNALKKRTGKSTEELTHSSNPLTRKRAVFAQNAAKWHHQYGGSVDDYNNPFHPMHQYMAEGGMYVDGGDTDPLTNLGNNSNPWGSTNPMQPTPAMPQMTNPDPNADARNQKYTTNTPSVSPMSPTNDQMVDTSGFNDPYAQQQPDTTAGPKQPRQYKGVQITAGIMGAGAGILGAASMYHDRFHNQQVQQQWMRDQNKSDNLPKYENPMSKGTYDQYGNMPYNNRSQSANIKTMKKGGYVKGQEVELDEKQINELIRKGYKLQKL